LIGVFSDTAAIRPSWLADFEATVPGFEAACFNREREAFILHGHFPIRYDRPVVGVGVPCKLADEVVAEEQRRHGASYDVSVISFGLDSALLDALPPADQLLAMPPTDFEKIAARITLSRIALGRDRENRGQERAEHGQHGLFS
jgi:hypothetical protein